jgi:hypothetical protein
MLLAQWSCETRLRPDASERTRFDSWRSCMKLPKRGYKWYFTRGKIVIDDETGCWLWMGAQYDDGYGKIRLPGGRSGMPVRAQNYFWQLYRGPLPHGHDVSHSCHRRLCVKMKHLKALNHGDNIRLMHMDYPFGPTDRERVFELLQEGRTFSFIADAIMAPRPAVIKLARRLDWRQMEFGV